MHKVIEVRIITPDEGIDIKDLSGLERDVNILSKLPPFKQFKGNEEVRRIIFVLHKGGKLNSYRVEDRYITAIGEYSDSDTKKYFPLEDVDKL